MSVNSHRVRKLTAWYHEPKPRCITITVAQTQCTFSASYQDKTGQIKVCKPHADMLILDGVKLTRIRPQVIDLRDERNVARVIPFRSA